MLFSGQELKMLTLKQELKISNLFLRGSVGLEWKMNDERMISQTPTVHKLDEGLLIVLSGLLEIWERVSEEESVKKSECGLSCWLVLPAVRKRRRENAICRVDWSVLPLAGQEAIRGREMVSAAFYVAPGRWPGKNGIRHSHWAKYINSNSKGQTNFRTK